MKKLIVFDYDGTLINSMEDAIDCLNIMLKNNHLPLINYNEKKYKEMTFEEIIKNITIKYKFNKKEMIKFKIEFEKIYEKHPKEKTKPYPNIYEMLKILQEDYLLAINSNKNTKSIKYFNKKFFKDIEFVEIIGDDMNIKTKPDPSGLLKIINNLKINLKDVIYVGDSTNDILTAKNANVDIVLVSWGQNSFKNADNVINDIFELKNILNNY